MKILLDNKKARFDYEILETFEAGLELRGWEVKSLKNKRGSLSGAHAIIRGGEIYIVGFNIPPYQAKNLPANYEEDRTLRLLLRKKEIKYLTGKLAQKRLTLTPIMVYIKGNKVKIKIGLAKGKRKYEKREKLKQKESKRRIERVLKGN